MYTDVISNLNPWNHGEAFALQQTEKDHKLVARIGDLVDQDEFEEAHRLIDKACSKTKNKIKKAA